MSRPIPAGIPSRRRTRKPAVPAGHEKTAVRSARKERLPSQFLTGGPHSVAAVSLSSLTLSSPPRHPSPSSPRSRSPFNLSTFQPRFRVRPKADFVSREAGFRVRRKWRRCCASQGHGMAAAMLAWVGAVPGPQDRQWRPAATVAFVVARSACRYDGFSARPPTVLHEASAF